MPSIKEVFHKFKDQLGSPVIVWLHGSDRKKIEQLTGNNWSKIVLPKDDKIKHLPLIINYFLGIEIDVYVNVNDHFEGSAPLTIVKINKLISSESFQK